MQYRYPAKSALEGMLARKTGCADSWGTLRLESSQYEKFYCRVPQGLGLNRFRNHKMSKPQAALVIKWLGEARDSHTHPPETV